MVTLSQFISDSGLFDVYIASFGLKYENGNDFSKAIAIFYV